MMNDTLDLNLSMSDDLSRQSSQTFDTRRVSQTARGRAGTQYSGGAGTYYFKQK